MLLRTWGSEPFPRHLGAFSGPVIAGEDPQETLLTKSNSWTKDLASKYSHKKIYAVCVIFLGKMFCVHWWTAAVNNLVSCGHIFTMTFNFLIDKAEISNYKPMKSHKALFLSIHGGEGPSDTISRTPMPLGVVICYVLPIKQSGRWSDSACMALRFIQYVVPFSDSSLVSLFPDSPIYPKFYNFGNILHRMVQGNVEIHPYTQEMLSMLDQ